MQDHIFELNQELEYRADEIKARERTIRRHENHIVDLNNSLNHHERELRSATSRSSTESADGRRGLTNKAVQGPVHYTRKNARPRFQPSAEGSWGAWAE